MIGRDERIVADALAATGALELAARRPGTLSGGQRQHALVLHDLNLAARYADQPVVMADGRIVTARPPAVVISAEIVRRASEIVDAGREIRRIQARR